MKIYVIETKNEDKVKMLENCFEIFENGIFVFKKYTNHPLNLNYNVASFNIDDIKNTTCIEIQNGKEGEKS